MKPVVAPDQVYVQIREIGDALRSELSCNVSWWG